MVFSGHLAPRGPFAAEAKPSSSPKATTFSRRSLATPPDLSDTTILTTAGGEAIGEFENDCAEIDRVLLALALLPLSGPGAWAKISKQTQSSSSSSPPARVPKSLGSPDPIGRVSPF